MLSSVSCAKLEGLVAYIDERIKSFVRTTSWLKFYDMCSYIYPWTTVNPC